MRQFVSSDEVSGGDKSRMQVFISYAWANDDVVLAVDAWLRSKGLRTKLDKDRDSLPDRGFATKSFA